MNPNARGGGGGCGSQPMSTATGAQINFEDLTPYLTYGREEDSIAVLAKGSGSNCNKTHNLVTMSFINIFLSMLTYLSSNK